MADITNKIRTLSEQQHEVVCLIEQVFWQTGAVPTNDYIAEKLRVNSQTVAKYWNQTNFREALIKRGVDLRADSSKQLLTPNQLLLANMLLNMHDKRSVREKLQDADVTSQQYHAWLKNSAFANYLRNRAEDLFSKSDHEAYLSLLDVVRNKDVQGLKLFFEMRGVYNPRVQVDMNIEALMYRIVEIVSKHVPDAEILQRIASDIEEIVSPRKALPVGNGISGGLPEL